MCKIGIHTISDKLDHVVSTSCQPTKKLLHPYKSTLHSVLTVSSGKKCFIIGQDVEVVGFGSQGEDGNSFGICANAVEFCGDNGEEVQGGVGCGDAIGAGNESVETRLNTAVIVLKGTLPVGSGCRGIPELATVSSSGNEKGRWLFGGLRLLIAWEVGRVLRNDLDVGWTEDVRVNRITAKRVGMRTSRGLDELGLRSGDRAAGGVESMMSARAGRINTRSGT